MLCFRKGRLGKVREEPTYTNTEQPHDPNDDKAARLDPNNKLYSIPQKHNNSSNKQIGKDIDKIKTLSLNRPPPGPQAYQSGVFLGEDSIHRLSSINRQNSLNPFLSQGIFFEDMELYENTGNVSTQPSHDQTVVQTDLVDDIDPTKRAELLRAAWIEHRATLGKTDKHTDRQTDRRSPEKQQLSEEFSDSETSTFSTTSTSYTYTSSSNNVNSSDQSRSASRSRSNFDSKDTNDSKLNRF